MSFTKRVVHEPPMNEMTLNSTHLFDSSKAPQQIQKTIQLVQLSRIVKQLSDLGLYSQEIFQGLENDAMNISNRIAKVRERTDRLMKQAPSIQTKILEMSMPASLLGDRPDLKPAPTATQLFTVDNLDPAMRNAYESCMPPPNLMYLDKFRGDGQTCMKAFSYPQFFMERWCALMDADAKPKKKKAKRNSKNGKGQEVKVSAIKVKRYNDLGEVIEEEVLPDGVSYAAGKPGSEMNTHLLTSPSAASDHTTMTTSSMRRSIVDGDVPFSLQVSPVSPDLQTQESKSPGTSLPPPSFLAGGALGRSGTPPTGMAQSVMQVNPLAMSARGNGMIDIVSPVSAASIAPPPPPPAPPAPPPPPAPPVYTVPEVELDDADMTPGAPPPPSGGASGINVGLISKVQLKKATPVAQETTPKGRDSVLDSIKGGSFNLRRMQVQPKAKTVEVAKGNDVASILMRRIALEASDSDDSGGGADGDDDEWD